MCYESHNASARSKRIAAKIEVRPANGQGPLAQAPSPALLLLLVDEWRAEAKRRRADAEDTRSMGNVHVDAQIGYAECLEDKATVIERLIELSLRAIYSPAHTNTISGPPHNAPEQVTMREGET